MFSECSADEVSDPEDDEEVDVRTWVKELQLRKKKLAGGAGDDSDRDVAASGRTGGLFGHDMYLSPDTLHSHICLVWLHFAATTVLYHKPVVRLPRHVF